MHGYGFFWIKYRPRPVCRGKLVCQCGIRLAWTLFLVMSNRVPTSHTCTHSGPCVPGPRDSTASRVGSIWLCGSEILRVGPRQDLQRGFACFIMDMLGFCAGTRSPESPRQKQKVKQNMSGQNNVYVSLATCCCFHAYTPIFSSMDNVMSLVFETRNNTVHREIIFTLIKHHSAKKLRPQGSTTQATRDYSKSGTQSWMIFRTNKGLSKHKYLKASMTPIKLRL